MHKGLSRVPVAQSLMLKVKRLSPEAMLPTVAHPGEDIGYDLYSVEEIIIPARGAAGVHTGIAIEFVPVAGGIVKTRSGMAKKRLHTTTAARGESGGAELRVAVRPCPRGIGVENHTFARV